MTFESNLNAKDKSEGQQWKGELFYIKDINSPYKIMKFDDLKSEINATDLVKDAWLCKSPLFNTQKSDVVFHRSFVVVKSGNNYYSIDKNDEGIYIQRSDKQEDVTNKVLGNQRNNVTTFKISGTKENVKLEELFKWINNTEVKAKYNFSDFDLNCQACAARCFTYVSGEKIKTTMFLE